MLSFRFSSIISFGLLFLTIVMISADESPEVPTEVPTEGPQDPVEVAAENEKVESNWSKVVAYARDAFAYTSTPCIFQAAWKCKNLVGSPWKAIKKCLRDQIEGHKSLCYTG